MNDVAALTAPRLTVSAVLHVRMPSAGYGLLCVFFAKGIDYMDSHMPEKHALNVPTSEQDSRDEMSGVSWVAVLARQEQADDSYQNVVLINKIWIEPAIMSLGALVFQNGRVFGAATFLAVPMPSPRCPMYLPKETSKCLEHAACRFPEQRAKSCTSTPLKSTALENRQQNACQHKSASPFKLEFPPGNDDSAKDPSVMSCITELSTTNTHTPLAKAPTERHKVGAGQQQPVRLQQPRDVRGRALEHGERAHAAHAAQREAQRELGRPNHDLPTHPSNKTHSALYHT
ncbi:hypothetical protein ON010_g16035 [Phytophthora cinnamomi]|nr:hypothetical protein ON010_g16035 [Phytophthora cinnamomi]